MFTTRINAPRLQASSPVTVYKVVLVDRVWKAKLLKKFPILVMFLTEVTSPYQGVKYTLNEVKTVPASELSPVQTKTEQKIRKGIYSFMNLDAARERIRLMNDPSAIILKATLPYDTIYYTNDMFEVVSSKIILTDDIVS